MLQFIVLGIVPGTSIQLTLDDIVLMIAVLMLCYIALDQVLNQALRRAARQILLGKVVTR